MTYKQAKAIINSEEIFSVDEIIEALSIIKKHEKKPTSLAQSQKSFQEWRKRNKDTTELRDLIRKYWLPKSP